jgi:hypothetical protein
MAQLTAIQVMQTVLPINIFDNTNATQLTLAENIIKDVFVDLEVCFKERFNGADIADLDSGDWDRVGVQANYNPAQVSLVGSFSAMRYLYRHITDFSQSITTSLVGDSGGRMISKAKAGSAEVEYDQRDIRNNPIILSGEKLMNELKSEVMRKGRNLGCIIDITEDNTWKIITENNLSAFPLMIIGIDHANPPCYGCGA